MAEFKISYHDKSFLFSVSSLFTTPKIKQVAELKHRNYLTRLTNNIILDNNHQEDITFGQIFDEFYEIIGRYYRSEYVYKNEIAKQLLLAKHSLADARLFTEVSVHSSKADVLIVNGTSTVYEIKTDLDSFDRLPSQIASYSLVFDNIYVVTSNYRLKTLRALLPDHVGIITLAEGRKLRTIRKAKSNRSNTDPAYIFNLLNKPEYLKIIDDYFGYVPDTTPVRIFEECKKLFCKIEPEIAHSLMVGALKKRGVLPHQVKFMKEVPDSLKFIAIAAKFNKSECENIDKWFKSFLKLNS